MKKVKTAREVAMMRGFAMERQEMFVGDNHTATDHNIDGMISACSWMLGEEDDPQGFGDYVKHHNSAINAEYRPPSIDIPEEERIEMIEYCFTASGKNGFDLRDAIWKSGMSQQHWLHRAVMKFIDPDRYPSL